MIVLEARELAAAKAVFAEIEQDIDRYLVYQRYPGISPYSEQQVAKSIESFRQERALQLRVIRSSEE